MPCLEKRELMAQIDEAVKSYRSMMDSFGIEGLASEDKLEQAGRAYNACKMSRAALQRHERWHGCSAVKYRVTWPTV
jgi:hypothetical protein